MLNVMKMSEVWYTELKAKNGTTTQVSKNINCLRETALDSESLKLGEEFELKNKSRGDIKEVLNILIIDERDESSVSERHENIFCQTCKTPKTEMSTDTKESRQMTWKPLHQQ